MAYRNLAIAYYNKCKEPAKALDYMKQAFELDSSYPRFLLEYDQLAAKNNVALEDRLALLEKYPELVEDRDVLYLEYITLLNETGQYDKALDALKEHTFHPWEGGEGKVSGQYRYAMTHKALGLMKEGLRKKQSGFLQIPLPIRITLGEGKLPNVLDNIAEYYIGCCYDALHATEEAARWWEKASVGLDEPSAALYYNDQPSIQSSIKDLQMLLLEEWKKAARCYHQLKSFGEKHIFDEVSYDYFAVSLPEFEVFPSDIQLRNTIDCKYLMALSAIGLGDYEKAQTDWMRCLHFKEIIWER